MNLSEYDLHLIAQVLRLGLYVNQDYEQNDHKAGQMTDLYKRVKAQLEAIK